MGDHSESILIEFEPKRLSYEKLLDVFFASHSPSNWSRQYRSAILYVNEDQLKAAQKALAKRGNALASKVALEPCGTFTQAEFYHQHYYLQNNPLYEKAGCASLAKQQFIDSFTCMRLNAVVNRCGDKALYERELDSYQLPDNSRAIVKEMAKKCDPSNYDC